MLVTWDGVTADWQGAPVAPAAIERVAISGFDDPAEAVIAAACAGEYGDLHGHGGVVWNASEHLLDRDTYSELVAAPGSFGAGVPTTALVTAMGALDPCTHARPLVTWAVLAFEDGGAETAALE